MISRKRTLAEQYFIEHGLMPAKTERTEKWDLHHKDPDLKYTDYDRYKEWHIEDLIPMTHSEHIKLHRIGSTQPEEVKKKIGIGNKGKFITDETRLKLSNVGKTKVGELNSFYGRHHSDETKAKLSELKQGSKPSNCIKVYCIELSKEYDSIAAATRDTKLHKKSIKKSCEKGCSIKGLTFKYI